MPHSQDIRLSGVVRLGPVVMGSKDLLRSQPRYTPTLAFHQPTKSAPTPLRRRDFRRVTLITVQRKRSCELRLTGAAIMLLSSTGDDNVEA
jgi:hypothetical protein